jgi:hypothetical protein
MDLSESGWTLTTGSISVPATVPSDQYLNLCNNGIIDDPLYGSNDSTQSWVYLTNWTYISPTIQGLNKQLETRLVFEGLDTFADISMCNQIVGSTNNQFRQWLFDVTDMLKQCDGARNSSLYLALWKSREAVARRHGRDDIWRGVVVSDAEPSRSNCQFHGVDVFHASFPVRLLSK